MGTRTHRWGVSGARRDALDEPLPLLINPNSGSAGAALDPLPRAAQALGVRLDIRPTRSADDMARRLRHAVEAGLPRVAVGGGDGTVAAAVQTLAGSETALTILPLGTANNFARALGLPLELEPALRVLRDGWVSAADLGRVGERWFIEAAGVGLFAEALLRYGPETDKNPFKAAQVLFGLWVGYRTHAIELTIDGETFRERVVMCSVANTSDVGPRAPVAMNARPDDGQLDVVVIGNVRRADVPRYAIAVARREHFLLPRVWRLAAREVRIESGETLAVHADDGVVGHTPVTVTVAPGVLRVVTPARSGEGEGV